MRSPCAVTRESLCAATKTQHSYKEIKDTSVCVYHTCTHMPKVFFLSLPLKTKTKCLTLADEILFDLAPVNPFLQILCTHLPFSLFQPPWSSLHSLGTNVTSLGPEHLHLLIPLHRKVFCSTQPAASTPMSSSKKPLIFPKLDQIVLLYVIVTLCTLPF